MPPFAVVLALNQLRFGINFLNIIAEKAIILFACLSACVFIC